MNISPNGGNSRITPSELADLEREESKVEAWKIKAAFVGKVQELIRTASERSSTMKDLCWDIADLAGL